MALDVKSEVETLKTHYRTIFISDMHLGTSRSRADLILHFLKHTESNKLYLVGDIIDNWALKRKWFWNQSHNDVIQKLLRKARKGTKVYTFPAIMMRHFAISRHRILAVFT